MTARSIVGFQAKAYGHRARRRRRRFLIDVAAAGLAAAAVAAGIAWAPAHEAAQVASHNPPAVFYGNCAAARAAGAAPIYAGQPGYRAALDADSDGIACEPYYEN
jgi:hypothetical protein